MAEFAVATFLAAVVTVWIALITAGLSCAVFIAYAGLELVKGVRQ